MRRVGLVLLYLWNGFNFLLAAGIVVAMAAFGVNAPALSILFGDTGIAGLDPRALATINALAILFNACAVGFCGLGLFLTKHSVARGDRKAFWALAGAMLFVQGGGLLSDAYLGNVNWLPNGSSSLILVSGLASTGLWIRRLGTR